MSGCCRALCPQQSWMLVFLALIRPDLALRRPREVVILDRGYFEDLRVGALSVQVFRLSHGVQKHFKAVSMLVHLVLLSQHLRLLLVNYLLHALEFGEVVVVICLDQGLQSLFHRSDFVPQLLLLGQSLFLLRFKLFALSVLLLKEFADCDA